MQKKKAAAITSIALAAALTVGGTLAYLQDAKQDTLTINGGDYVRVDSMQHDVIQDAKVIPGKTINFNPSITVSNSVDAYAFIQFDGSGMSYLSLNGNVNGEWMPLQEADGVYFREIQAQQQGAPGQTFNILSSGQISFDSALTNEDVAQIGMVDINVKGYAIQKDYVDLDNDGNSTPAEAWQAIQQP